MNQPTLVPLPRNSAWMERDCRGANSLFTLGVVLLCFGTAITGRHETTMIGLALIVFSSLCDW